MIIVRSWQSYIFFLTYTLSVAVKKCINTVVCLFYLPNHHIISNFAEQTYIKLIAKLTIT